MLARDEERLGEEPERSARGGHEPRQERQHGFTPRMGAGVALVAGRVPLDVVGEEAADGGPVAARSRAVEVANGTLLRIREPIVRGYATIARARSGGQPAATRRRA